MSNRTESDTIELSGLEKLIKAFKKRPPQIKIGILGSSTHQSKSKSVTNATIGAAHEFGSPARNLPTRSFLRMPLSDYLGKELDKSGVYSKEYLENLIKKGTLLPLAKLIAGVALGVVDDAFETEGFGKWPKWKDPNYQNEGGLILTDSGQLRQSISSEVVE